MLDWWSTEKGSKHATCPKARAGLYLVGEACATCLSYDCAIRSERIARVFLLPLRSREITHDFSWD
jgi:hypothetical protein